MKPRISASTCESFLLVAAVAAAVRLPGVYGRSFWEDEVASARVIVQPTFSTMLRRVEHTESTPPLWYGIAWVAHQVGMPVQSERLLSVAFGVMFSISVVVLARRFVSLLLATAAGLLVALGEEFVVHGAELRSYEFFALLSTSLGLCVLELLHRPARRWDVALAATVGAGCLTHYFFAFSAAGVLAWLWLDPGARQIRRRGTTAVLAGATAAASATPILLVQYKHGGFRWIGSFRWRNVVAVPLRLFTYSYSHLPVGPLLSGTALVVLGIGGVALGRHSPGGRLIVVLASAPIAAAAAAWSAGMPIFDLRNLIGVGAYVAVLAVGALETLPGGPRSLAAVAAVGGTALSLLTSNAGRIPAYDAMARTLVAKGWNVSKPIVVYGDPYRYRLPFEWYLPHHPVFDMSHGFLGHCAEVFFVTPTGKVKAGRLATHADLERGTLLVDPQHQAACPNPRRSWHSTRAAHGNIVDRNTRERLEGAPRKGPAF